MAETEEKVAEFIRLESAEDRLRVVCKRVQMCYEDGTSVAVRVASREEAEQLDGMMWTFQDISFIPHVRSGEAEQPVLEPVIIYSVGEPVGGADVLIEAAEGEPGDHFRQFDHVFDFAEVYDEALKEASRRRYKAYQQAGYRMRYIR
jgi:DNA polymerase-3 subunit chi